MQKLNVLAQGTHMSTDDRLILVVEVTNSTGDPTAGLTDQHFSVRQMAHHFGDLDPSIVVDLGDSIAELAGTYHLVRKDWSPAGNGTYCFRVDVKSREHGSGHTLAWVVKAS